MDWTVSQFGSDVQPNSLLWIDYYGMRVYIRYRAIKLSMYSLVKLRVYHVSLLICIKLQ